MEEEEMKEYDEWFTAMCQFGFAQFDRQQLQRLSWRDFRMLARHDLTVKNIMEVITPKHNEYDCLKYAQAIQRKHEKKRSKKDRKKREKLNQLQQTNQNKEDKEEEEAKVETNDETLKQTEVTGDGDGDGEDDTEKKPNIEETKPTPQTEQKVSDK